MSNDIDNLLLWHYTSFEVLCSIFKNPEEPVMRASHVAFLNDKSEHIYGLHRIIESTTDDNDNDTIEKLREQERLLKEIAAAAGLNIHSNSINTENFGELKEYVNSLEKDIITSYLMKENSEYYSFSLSAAKNSLYQWLVYSPKQGGIALGFDKTFLDHITLNETKESIAHREVIYPNLGENIGNLKELKDAVFIKHPAYKQEEEYRVTVDLNDKKDAICYSDTKPYIELSFKPSLLKEIYISPQGDKEQLYRLVEHWLSNNPILRQVKVTVSDIPFRG